MCQINSMLKVEVWFRTSPSDVCVRGSEDSRKQTFLQAASSGLAKLLAEGCFFGFRGDSLKGQVDDTRKKECFNSIYLCCDYIKSSFPLTSKANGRFWILVIIQPGTYTLAASIIHWLYVSFEIIVFFIKQYTPFFKNTSNSKVYALKKKLF